MIFKKNDIAVINGEKHMCIISDDEIAVLGLMVPIDDIPLSHSVKYEGCTIYSNRLDMKDTIQGLERVEDIHGMEKTEFEPDPEYGMMTNI